ncbi:MAG TPA: hypothetical protein VIG61_05105 [Fusobacterium sp.]
MLCFFASDGSNPRSRVETDENSWGGVTYSGSVLSGERKNTVIITDKDIEKKQYKNVTEIFEDSPFTMVTHTPAGPVVALRGSGDNDIMMIVQ